MSSSNSSAAFESRASVYLIAAAESPSIDPLLPCISIKGVNILKSCESLTIAL